MSASYANWMTQLWSKAGAILQAFGQLFKILTTNIELDLSHGNDMTLALP
jgi:hypothetical protein